MADKFMRPTYSLEMKNKEDSEHLSINGRLKRVLQRGVVPVVALSLMGSVVFYSRNLVNAPDQNYFQVLAWQLLSWLPWAYVFMKVHDRLAAQQTNALHWLVVSVVVAFASSLWFLIASDFISPYLGRSETMFGLYKWFLIFWFIISLLLFWAHMGLFLIRAQTEHPPVVSSPFQDETRLAIWNKGHHVVVDKKDVISIEAQDYYACISLANGKVFWAKMRLTPLMDLLDSPQFVRVHRSAIINTTHLLKIDRCEENYWQAVLANHSRIRLSRAGRAELEKALHIVK